MWLVLTGAAFISALGWGVAMGSSGGGEKVSEKIIAAFANPSCQVILKLPAQTKLSQEPYGDSPCWDLYLYRLIYENASATADGYVKDIEIRQRNWMLGMIGIGLAYWLVGTLLVLAVGFLVAWVRKGFSLSPKP